MSKPHRREPSPPPGQPGGRPSQRLRRQLPAGISWDPCGESYLASGKGWSIVVEPSSAGYGSDVHRRAHRRGPLVAAGADRPR